MLKLGFREGDAAEVAILELVDYTLDKSTKKSDEKTSDEKKRAVSGDASES